MFFQSIRFDDDFWELNEAPLRGERWERTVREVPRFSPNPRVHILSFLNRYKFR